MKTHSPAIGPGLVAGGHSSCLIGLQLDIAMRWLATTHHCLDEAVTVLIP